MGVVGDRVPAWDDPALLYGQWSRCAAASRRWNSPSRSTTTLSIRTDQWDVLVQVGPLPDSALALRRMAPNRRIVCATPAYLAEHGNPDHPADLEKHVCSVIGEDQADGTLWGFTAADGATATVRVRPELTSNDGTVIKDWAFAGLGIVQRSEWDVADDLRAGQLVEVASAGRRCRSPARSSTGTELHGWSASSKS
jgi:DNA-binding transcriptional LysR family regulator